MMNIKSKKIYIIKRSLKNFLCTKKSYSYRSTNTRKAINLCFKFLKEIINIRKLNNYDIANIINCDETPIYLNAPSSLTSAKKEKNPYI